MDNEQETVQSVNRDVQKIVNFIDAGGELGVFRDNNCFYFVDENGKQLAEICGGDLAYAFMIALGIEEPTIENV